MKKNIDAFYWIAVAASSVIGVEVSNIIYDKVWEKTFAKTDNLLTTSIVSCSIGLASNVAVFVCAELSWKKGLKSLNGNRLSIKAHVKNVGFSFSRNLHLILWKNKPDIRRTTLCLRNL